MNVSSSIKNKILQRYHDRVNKPGLSLKSTVDIDDYNIFTETGLPSRGHYADNLPDCLSKGIKWGTTTEFDRYGKNHCASVSIFNIIQYYAHLLKSPDLNGHTRLDTFESIYNLAGKGPTIPVSYRSAFVNSIIPHYKAYAGGRAVSWDNYVAAIRDQRMVYLVLWPSLFNAHYVNGIGFREYYSGEKYVRIVDNWRKTTDRYYRWDASICRFMGFVYISK